MRTWRRKGGRLVLANDLGTTATGTHRRGYRDFPSGPMAKTLHWECRGQGSVPGPGARSHMPPLTVLMLQLQISRAETKPWRSQINKYFLKKKRMQIRLFPQPLLPRVTDCPVKVKFSQLCPILCDSMDYTVHGILQARILEWVANPFRGSFQPNPGIKPRSPTSLADSLPAEPPGNCLVVNRS